jgi:DNA polymerase III epsilon subunit family exonuclease
MNRSEKIAELRSLLETKVARDRMLFEQLAEMPIDSVPFWVVDVETTGDRSMDRIIEVAAIKVREGEMQRVIHTLVDPGRPVSSFAQNLTGINNRMLAAAPKPHEVYPWLFSHLKNGVFVAHRASFDRSFIDREAILMGLKRLTIPTFCTVRLSKRLIFDLPGYSLDHIANYFGLEFGIASSPSSRHRALGDAWVCAKAFISLLALARKIGLRTFGEVHELESMPIRKAKNLWRI